MSDTMTREEFEDLLLSSVDENLGDLSGRLEKLLGVDAALRACIQQAVLDVEKLPHSVRCKSRAVIDDTPWGEFTEPICRSINGCGHCEKCKWKETRPMSVHFPCNCGHDAAIDGLKKGLGEK